MGRNNRNVVGNSNIHRGKFKKRKVAKHLIGKDTENLQETPVLSSKNNSSLRTSKNNSSARVLFTDDFNNTQYTGFTTVLVLNKLSVSENAARKRKSGDIEITNMSSSVPAKKTKVSSSENNQLLLQTAKRLKKRAGVKYSQQIKEESTHINLEGKRIVSLQNMAHMVGTLTVHAATCEKLQIHLKETGKSIELQGEVRRDGLVSFFRCHCPGCEEYFYFDSDSKLRDGNGHKRYGINLAAVWGSMAVGGGASKLGEILSTMGVPPICDKTFSRIEHQIGKWWQRSLDEELLKAAREESDIARREGSFHGGVPAITVIVDGGWSKRSHKHSYNALGGVAIVIGAKTGKLLHLGVRVKYCAICTRAENLKQPPKLHECFKLLQI